MKYPKQKIVVWGGWAVMSRPEFILRENPGVDYAVVQEGEDRLLKLLEARKSAELFDTIDGVAYRDEQGRIITRGSSGARR